MDDCELKLLTEAAADIERLKNTTDRYLTLRRMIANATADRKAFESKFSSYHGLNRAGLTNKWKERYFELLFLFKKQMPKEPHQAALKELFSLPRIKKDHALQFSFVSKLVAIHDEQEPIFDRYVQSYFGLGPPSLAGLIEFRISGFLQNLNEVGRRYKAWSDYEPFVEILGDLRQNIPALKDCHTFRICDFLVWSVGKKYQRAYR